MSDQGSDDQVAQRRDALLLRLLKTPRRAPSWPPCAPGEAYSDSREARQPASPGRFSMSVTRRAIAMSMVGL
jgi:hypothetical protein